MKKFAKLEDLCTMKKNILEEGTNLNVKVKDELTDKFKKGDNHEHDAALTVLKDNNLIKIIESTIQS